MIKKPPSGLRREDNAATKAPGGWCTVRDKNVHGTPSERANDLETNICECF